jgi:tetratricopeptide (TPR) repeat protein
LLLGLLTAGLCSQGCASAPQPSPTTHPVAASVPHLDPKANLTLAQVPPDVQLPPPTITPGSPADRINPPVEALILYAAARDAMVRNDPAKAIGLLNKALRLDPDSFDLNSDLAQAYLMVNPADERGVPPLLRAVELQPDNLGLQTELGRIYAAQGDLPKAALHLRYARLSSDYQHGDSRAALVDFFLGHVLEEQGYLRAALECDLSLVERLDNLPADDRTNPEIEFFLQRPELLFLQIASLEQRLGHFKEALVAYRQVAQSRPDDDDIRRQLVTLEAQAGQFDDAAADALAGVKSSSASPDWVELLRLVWRAKGNEAGAADAIGTLQRGNAGDVALVLARTQVLLDCNRPDDAARVLATQIDKFPDPRLIRHLVQLDVDRGDRDSAARLLVETTARDHELIAQVAPIWEMLQQPTPYRIERLSEMKFSPAAQPVRDLWVSQLAATNQRNVASQAALDRALAARPVLRWAWRDALLRALDQANTPDQRRAAATRLSDQARQAGDPALADELIGLAALAQGSGDTAAAALKRAVAAGDDGPYVQLQLAQADRLRGAVSDFERRMWRLASDYPGYDEALLTLFRYYQNTDRSERAALVLRSWLAQDPQNINALLVRVLLLGAVPSAESSAGSSGVAGPAEIGQEPDAATAADNLVREYGNDPQVLITLHGFYAHNNRLWHYAELLQQRLAAHPKDVVTLQELIDVLNQQGRTPEAAQVLDRTHAAVQDDPERLLAIAHLYEQVDRAAQTPLVLAEVLHRDPQNPGANNDLGYEWADQGKQLPQAERMIRSAVAAEPDNEAFLDSLGWVLYKQGRFSDARPWLANAAQDQQADPTIFDHLGDTLYRLSQTNSARQSWQQALDRLGSADADNDPAATAANDPRAILKAKLRAKLQQLKDQQPVEVAPLAQPVRSSAAIPFGKHNGNLPR